MQSRHARWLHERLTREGWTVAVGGVDYESRDSARGLHIVEKLQGRGQFDASALQVARWLEKKPTREAAIVLMETRMGDERLESEYRSIRGVLRSSVGRRLAVAVADRGRTLGPEFAWLAPVLTSARGYVMQHRTVTAAMRGLVSARSFEVLKLVVQHYLLKTGPIHRNRLMKESGASYPTVVRALNLMEERGELERLGDRRVTVPAFPHRTWQEMLALASTLRRPMAYRDASGRKADPPALLRKLETLRPEHVALGGVAAARVWDEHFDLHGLPRLDVVWHVTEGASDLTFVRQLDSALAIALSRLEEPVLVVHALRRREALFRRGRAVRLDVADPVETLLDLHELRLTEQADELVRRLLETAVQ